MVGGSQRTICKCSWRSSLGERQDQSVLITVNKTFLLQEDSHWERICAFLQRSASTSEPADEGRQRQTFVEVALVL